MTYDNNPTAQPTHTVAIFITYRRSEPIPSKEWAEKTGLAFRHAPFVIEAVTAADFKTGVPDARNEQSGSTNQSDQGVCKGGDSFGNEEDRPTSDVAGSV